MGDFIRSLLRNSSSHHRSWQLSAALALGVLCGLLPKFSLMFCIIGCLCCAAPIHLPLAALACLFGSFASTFLADTVGRVGLWSLTHPELMEAWLTLNAQPWVPWLGLNNSVVHGSLLIGLASLLPVYTLTKPIANRLAPARLPLGAGPADADFEHELKPLVASCIRSESTAIPNETSVACIEMHRLKIGAVATCPDADDKLDVDQQTYQKLESLLATCNGEDANDLSAERVVQRAAQMAHFVDELLTSCLLESSEAVSKSLRQDEVRECPVPQLHVNQSLSTTDIGLTKRHADQAKDYLPKLVGATSSPQLAVGEVHQAETLRYLLHHLKAIKDKV
ncbi:MAG: hypothetical protein ABI557_13390 [Aureliella sp.]